MNLTEIMNGTWGFMQFFFLGLMYLFVFSKLYIKVTPYDEIALIKQGNIAASISLFGAVIGFVLPVASVVFHTHLLSDMAIWSAIALVVQLSIFQVIKKFVLPNVKEAIESGNMACGVFIATISLSVGIINAVSIS